ncbi:MAG TPA: hypothetical protein VJ161_13120, partial [Geobacteraceae bacterium]|nr:hypothetical protein [Geobacteraceae bacterium]
RLSMGNCASCGNGAGPFAEGRELVEFVFNAHGGGLRNQRIPDGGLETICHGCGTSFTLTTYVGKCPECGGVYAVSPPRSSDPANIQFAGKGYLLPEG